MLKQYYDRKLNFHYVVLIFISILSFLTLYLDANSTFYNLKLNNVIIFFNNFNKNNSVHVKIKQ